MIEYQRNKWKPVVHCSNCLNCIVFIHEGQETVKCKAGHGDYMPLGRVIRQPYGRGFRSAADCPDYKDMS